ncbi:MAG: aspartate kinase [Christensenellaceae bacterium]|jgi:aspartate kinase|nr:aspartate kinase [Christensenellaceae bacterium]
MRTCKFGGTSMASAETFKRVKDIIFSEPDRQFVIVSAPGKRFKDDVKVTDLLYSAFEKRDDKTNPDLALIEKRFLELEKDLGVNAGMAAELSTIRKLLPTKNKDYAASRGEYLSAKLFAAFSGFNFVDASCIIKFDRKGNLDSERTYELVSHIPPQTVIPGFYGDDVRGEIRTFSRGGSDVTGSIVARGTGSTLYENFTDVDGFMTADPRIVDNPRIMDVLSYAELRELAYMGANVLHPDSVLPVLKADIPINIKNTFAPEKKGTLILPTHEVRAHLAEYSRGPITGIAGKTNFTTIFIAKSMMNSEIGFGKRILEVLDENRISFEHLPTGIDTMSVIISGDVSDEIIDRLIDGIYDRTEPDKIKLFRNLSLIAVVGHGMVETPGIAARTCTALYKSGINIRMLDQGSSELNIIVGVKDNDYKNALKAIYKEFNA